MALAEMLADSRQFTEALGLLGGICDEAPTALSPRLLQLRILLELGEKDSALGSPEALREKLPDDPEVVLLWAESLQESERPTTPGRPWARSSRGGRRSHEQKARRHPRPDGPGRAAAPGRRGASAQLKAAAGSARPGGPHGELHVEIVHVAIAPAAALEAEEARRRIAPTQADVARAPTVGALLARSHGLWAHARSSCGLAPPSCGWGSTPAEAPARRVPGVAARATIVCGQARCS